MKLHLGRTLALMAAASLAATPAMAETATRSSQSIPVAGVQQPTKAKRTATEEAASAVQYDGFTGSSALLIGLVLGGGLLAAVALGGGSGGGDSP